MAKKTAKRRPSPMVGLIMGSQSDWATMRHTAETLEALGVPFEARIISAHRTPKRMMAYAAAAKGRGLKVIVAGGTYIPPQILPDVAEVPTLTGRQIEVLMLITKGASNRDIAQALGIADNTAKQHTHAVFQALNVNTRAQATIAAARLGIGTA